MPIAKKTSAVLAVAVAAMMAGPAFGAGKELNKDNRTYYQNGNIEYGKIGDSYTAALVLYLAGNQFMVIDDLMKDFLKKHPSIRNVYVETVPPGQILKGQLLKQGQIDGENTAMNPDVFASVNLGHLQTLKAKGLMSDYKIYTHNKLELMVAKGNPKNIKGPKDLGRNDLVLSMPNPLTEGIFKFYTGPMLKELGLFEKVTGGVKCKSCWAVPGKTWFTSRHHRETPTRIEKGQADVGVVWATEVTRAKRQGRPLEGVNIPAPLNMGDKVGYAIGILNTGRNQAAALHYVGYLRTKAAQAIYVKYGFIAATPEETALKPIPAK